MIQKNQWLCWRGAPPHGVGYNFSRRELNTGGPNIIGKKIIKKKKKLAILTIPAGMGLGDIQFMWAPLGLLFINDVNLVRNYLVPEGFIQTDT